MNYIQSPACNVNECFACKEGSCLILTKNNFNKKCPFFKTNEQVAKEKEYCAKRLDEIRGNKEN